MKKISQYLSQLYIYHYLKLAFRIVLFVVTGALYLISRLNGCSLPFGEAGSHRVFWGILWIILVVEMIFRIFPAKFETIGCQKQLKRNYVPTGEVTPVLTPGKATFSFAALWIAINLAFGILYLTGIIDAGILILLTFAYGICDIVCILFFCPIRDWFLKNKCCTDCRIYNWDYAMMFTPLALIPHPYTLSLFGISLALLITWEVFFRLHPERFAENTNACLACENCTEKLCHHKKQLVGFLRKNRELIAKYLKEREEKKSKKKDASNIDKQTK